MGRLAGFRHREVVRRLKRFGFHFARHAAGSHEIWFNRETRRYTTDERLAAVPDELYGSGIGSYQRQGLQLAKQFPRS